MLLPDCQNIKDVRATLEPDPDVQEAQEAEDLPVLRPEEDDAEAAEEEVNGGEAEENNCDEAINDAPSATNGHPAAYMENDAIGCYDRLVNSLILLLMVKLGLPTSPAKCLGNIWDTTTHFIKTIYGTSEITYRNSPATPLFRSGQGSTCGPLFWLLCFTLIMDSMDPFIKASTLISVCNQVTVQSIGVAFVDDSSLGVTMEYSSNDDLIPQENETLEIQHLSTKIGHLAQHWECLLFSTGGANNLQKSHWYLMFFRWLQWYTDSTNILSNDLWILHHPRYCPTPGSL